MEGVCEHVSTLAPLNPKPTRNLQRTNCGSIASQARPRALNLYPTPPRQCPSGGGHERLRCCLPARDWPARLGSRFHVRRARGVWREHLIGGPVGYAAVTKATEAPERVEHRAAREHPVHLHSPAPKSPS